MKLFFSFLIILYIYTFHLQKTLLLYSNSIMHRCGLEVRVLKLNIIKLKRVLEEGLCCCLDDENVEELLEGGS